MTRDSRERCLETSQGSRLGESNPRPTHYECVPARSSLNQTPVHNAVREVLVLAINGC